MFVIQVSVLLQIMFQFMVAGQVVEDVTQSYIEHSSPMAGTTDQQKLPSGYIAYPEIGFAYKKFDDQLTYNEARKVCLHENGQLAVIDSREKANKILNDSNSNVWAWVGLGSFFDAAEWTTIDGKSTSNLPWGDGEPDEDHKCVFLWSHLNGLANGKCDNQREYLCEIPLSKH